MARPTYGRTWWGARWLDALTHIDYDNRLPRGRSYANKGAVRDLAIEGGTIRAKVKGSRAQPYRVTIEVPPVPAAQVEKLLGQIAADHVLIARLLNRELDPVLLELTTALGIGIFPARWQDLHMQCSCPDWAVPCKHLAATIYLLSQEIDSNPFLVFRLRGIDLAQALRSYDIHVGQATGATLPTVAQMLQGDTVLLHADVAPDSGAREMADPDLSGLPPLLEPLINILPERPACFAGGDLRAIYLRVVTRAARQARRTLDAVPAATARHSAPDPFHAADRPRLEIDDACAIRVCGLSERLDWAGLVSGLGVLEPSRLPDLQPDLAMLHHIRLIALHLLAAGAVSAQVFSPGEHEVGLRWMPALIDPLVRTRMQHLARELPGEMVSLRTAQGSAPLSREAQTCVLCSSFLDHFIHLWGEGQDESPAGDKTLALFFTTGHARFDRPGEGSTAGGIQSWLAHHQIARHTHRPVLSLAQAGTDNLALTVAVEKGRTDAVVTPLAVVLAEPSWAGERLNILQDIARLAEFFPPLATYAREGARAPIILPLDDLPGLLRDTLPAIRLLGMRTLMPRALERLLRPRLSLRATRAKPTDGAGTLKADLLFSFDWRVALGDHLLTRKQFETLVGHAADVIRFRGEYVYLDPEEIARLRAQLDQPPRLEGAAGLRVALAGEYFGAPISLDASVRKTIRELNAAGEVALPDGIDAQLRPYQRAGYAWLYRNARTRFGSVIADDMGLGKTLQVIATLQKLKEDDPRGETEALVVVPTSLLTNWQKEVARFAPGLSVEVFHGSRRELTRKRPDVLLTSYGVARREAAALKAMDWRVLVLDEAQNIKNPATAQTKAIKSIPAQSFIAMSGTPVENRLSEYWSIMDFANRGYLGSLAGFVKQYAVPIQAHRDPAALERFRRVTAPFLLRRLKSDRRIIDDLPDKIEQDQYCVLTPTQVALYESAVREGLRVIQGESDGFKRQGLVLQMILALKQICNHPAQYLKQGKTEPALSGKAERLLELVDEIHANHEKVLIFTQFREMGELLRTWLEDHYRQAPLFLHGGVTRKQRDAMVDRFQHDRTERIFILSLKAGGTGLNLTAASNVIHYDLWWNPAVEAQATDRAYRIGQHSNVQVHRLIARDTFEERINDLIRSKRELAELTVGTGEKWIGNLSTDEMEALFVLQGSSAHARRAVAS